MRVLSGLLLSVFAVTGPTACNDINDKISATLTVSTDDLVLGGEAGESETFTITTPAAWKAVPSGEGFTLDKTEGTGDATVRVTAAAGNWDGYVKQLGSIEIAATNVDGVKTVSVSQDEITPVLPSEVTLVADFTLGASVATPELPPYSTDNFTTGRHEYTIGGYTFAIFVDPDEGGKFYWLDNKQFSPSIPDPAQGLFFSKLGAYVEFPAITGKVLSEVHYLPTSQQNDVSLDLFGAGDDMGVGNDISVGSEYDPSTGRDHSGAVCGQGRNGGGGLFIDLGVGQRLTGGGSDGEDDAGAGLRLRNGRGRGEVLLLLPAAVSRVGPRGDGGRGTGGVAAIEQDC